MIAEKLRDVAERVRDGVHVAYIAGDVAARVIYVAERVRNVPNKVQDVADAANIVGDVAESERFE